ncbi:MAG: hypothetical protein A3G33_00405 [Omnitrophica bacterium RIFCSPLOWO2_12_FULL_44_17]|uniref:AMP-activated protein kinase glycogen-binding domain-containing protein n=1 Tax=Candidatus Danuiimicrobium aquiferis TaxID=1801832 RepID=A0A1G1KSE1_9BACT|nr:MAG: hypothetical protein A3B72_07975 [Omnitrophica bacterium RIFCSPHIGHO2_02_FULL_45_28]OGW95851.1 MAG: hypothetical protein A3G33_00405 [Omnitrophica bacterium RIFCSPLOWO2_12_FULL_44_17]OGX01952.1 MAG: hypothetical protein A3J12_01815 [Omnitrophica bacterium RIFCSPLOWO2_02_FULL_44_11]
MKFEFYAPLAKSVRIGGDFNKWNPSKTVLEKKSDGRWITTLSLKGGRYEYRYQVDGNWENDQRQVKLVPNAYGSWNCVLEVQ